MAVLEKEILRGPALSTPPAPVSNADDQHGESIRLRPFTREEYYRLGEVGILGPEERTELIEGVIYTMPPPGPEHSYEVDDLASRLRAIFGDGFRAREEKPVLLGESDPQPDVAVIVASPELRHRHPGPADVRLVVEVSNSTLAFDRTTKLGLYARSGIADYWIVNVPDRQIEVYREPDGSIYKSTRIYGPGESVEPLAAPGKAVCVDDVLPPAEA